MYMTFEVGSWINIRYLFQKCVGRINNVMIWKWLKILFRIVFPFYHTLPQYQERSPYLPPRWPTTSCQMTCSTHWNLLQFYSLQYYLSCLQGLKRRSRRLSKVPLPAKLLKNMSRISYILILKNTFLEWIKWTWNFMTPNQINIRQDWICINVTLQKRRAIIYIPQNKHLRLINAFDDSYRSRI